MVNATIQFNYTVQMSEVIFMNEQDLRVVKTKKALSSSLYQLLEKRSFESLSVNEICESGMVHRTTFYKHFYDKYDLLVYLFKLLTKDYFSTDLKDRLNNPFQTIEATFTNKEELEKIEKVQKDDVSFGKIFKEVCVDIMKADIKENIHRISVDKTIPEDLVFYIYGSTLDGFMEWIKQENIQWPASEIDKVFHKAINISISEQIFVL